MQHNRFKFRAWIPTTKRMLSWDEILSASNMRIYFEDTEFLMQSTGLLDKNGKLIFEGDVVRGKFMLPLSDSLLNREVKYSDGYFSTLVTANDYSESGSINEYDPNDFEVIGNIYESPELLK